MKPSRQCENEHLQQKIIDGIRPTLTSKNRRSKSQNRKEPAKKINEKPQDSGQAIQRSKSSEEEFKTQKSLSKLKREETKKADEKTPEQIAAY